MHTVWIHLLWVLAMIIRENARPRSGTNEHSNVCETCTRVNEIYGSTETVAPWLCECRTATAQSSLPVAKPDAQQRITLSGTPLQQLANWRNLKP